MSTNPSIVKMPKPYHENRPWGEFIKFVENSPCTVKILKIKSGECFSLQYHESRDEFWHIISGTGIATVGTEKFEIESEKEYFVPKKTLHRIEAKTDIELLEICYGAFNESDIVRVEDKYKDGERQAKQNLDI